MGARSAGRTPPRDRQPVRAIAAQLPLSPAGQASRAPTLRSHEAVRHLAATVPRPRPMKTRSIPVAPDQVAELHIEAAGDNGDGIGKVGGYVVFVPRALPGERVRVRITSAGSKHGRAELLAVLSPAPERIAPRCPHFGACGGCQLQHMAYDAQLARKRAWVEKALRHTLRRDVPVAPLLA